jgi:ribonucleoside-diphosphate reductase alpha chain
MRSEPLPPGVSAGYLRLGANKSYPRFVSSGAAPNALEPPHPPIEVRASPAAPADMSLGPTKADRMQAQQSGYTGDQCDNCSSMKMKISGHCMVCDECGTTTGCS